MVSEIVKLEREDDIAIITLKRPPFNPLNSQVFYDFNKALAEIEADSSIKSVIITGSGEKAFAAGADVNEVASNTSLEQHEFLKLILSVFNRLENLEKPTIAAVNGLALGGGCELTLACDFRIAAENAKFGQPEINIGVIPGGGGTQRLPRLIGLSRAKEMLFLGEAIDAATAEKYGLANKVVPKEQLLDTAKEFAKKLASKPIVAMKILKRTVNAGQNIDLLTALNLEIDSFIVAFSSDDRVEGINAMLEKRKPHFTGK
ncbi:MAG: enoyl-CoA hydratase-related protein [Bacillota bacterium]|nr:enoyl-CoA hydratase-related protein [Bacillota bacterium]